MTHSLEGQKAKHKNWKFEDEGLKRRFYKGLDSVLDVATGGLLRFNKGKQANTVGLMIY